MSRVIVYLHGFRSSPASIKATRLRAYVDALPSPTRPTLHIPELTHAPAVAVASVAAWVEANARGDDVSAAGPSQGANCAPSGGSEAASAASVGAVVTFVGSSLGGFYATHLAERFDARAVMINPAVQPQRDLAPWIGVQTNLYTGAPFEVKQEHFAELAALRVPRITRPERYFLLVETGDEVLDYREAVAHYGGAYQYVRGGGDHTFTEFAAQIPAILRFAGVAS